MALMVYPVFKTEGKLPHSPVFSPTRLPNVTGLRNYQSVTIEPPGAFLTSWTQRRCHPIRTRMPLPPPSPSPGRTPPARPPSHSPPAPPAARWHQTQWVQGPGGLVWVGEGWGGLFERRGGGVIRNSPLPPSGSFEENPSDRGGGCVSLQVLMETGQHPIQA